MSTVKSYLSLIKFSHTIFALPFALIGFFLGADYFLDLSSFSSVNSELYDLGATRNTYLSIFSLKFWLVKFALVLLCMVFARSAAMAYNRYLDRHFDAKNPRTATREIPAGIINEGNALIFTIINALLFIVTCYFINSICFFLAPVALFVILFYSYTKRFTALCHLVLGIGLSLAPIGAYLAVTGAFALLPLLFSFAVVFWVTGFDIIYALQDEAFDKENQLYSVPAVMGKSKALRVSELFHVFSALSVIAAGIYGHFGLIFWLGNLVFVGMLLYQHSIVSPSDLTKVNVAFMTANGIASVVFAAFVVLDLFLF